MKNEKMEENEKDKETLMGTSTNVMNGNGQSSEIVDLSASGELYDKKTYLIHENLTIHVEKVKLRQNFSYQALVFTRLPKNDVEEKEKDQVQKDEEQPMEMGKKGKGKKDKEKKKISPFRFHIRADVTPKIIDALTQIMNPK